MQMCNFFYCVNLKPLVRPNMSTRGELAFIEPIASSANSSAECAVLDAQGHPSIFLFTRASRQRNPADESRSKPSSTQEDARMKRPSKRCVLHVNKHAIRCEPGLVSRHEERKASLAHVRLWKSRASPS